MRRLAALLALLLPATASAGTFRGDVTVLAWSMAGDLALVQESADYGEDGSFLAYRVVGPGVLQKQYVLSEQQPDEQDRMRQHVPREACKATLLELRDVLRETKFKGITLSGDACAGDRLRAVEVAEEQSAAAEQSELDLSPARDAFVKGDWRLELDSSSLTVRSGAESKKLHLPRPIPAAAANVVLSPTRRLLLIFVSLQGGDRMLAAGFSSKTGKIADFQ